MSVSTKGRLNVLLQLTEELESHSWRHDTDGVGDVQHLRARVLRGLADLDEVVHVSPSRILRAKLHAQTVVPSILDAFHTLPQDLLPRRLHHSLDVEVACADEDVNVGDVAPECFIDVLLQGSG